MAREALDLAHRDRERLLDIFRRMSARYGPQGWWPGDTPFEVMVGAVLTQATSWTNVEKALANLKAADALSPSGIRFLDESDLARLIYPSGYYNAKARKLRALVDYLGRRFDDDLDAMAREEMGSLRAELLGVYGIGEETADDILLYALRMPSFVVDSYTKRVLFATGRSRGACVVRRLPRSLHRQPTRGQGAVQRVPRPHRSPRQRGVQKAPGVPRLLPARHLPHR